MRLHLYKQKTTNVMVPKHQGHTLLKFDNTHTHHFEKGRARGGH